MKLKLHATGKDLKIIEAERLISGSRKIYSCEFTFDDSWDGYTVTAVFSTNSSRLVNMAIVDGVCEIPSEVLRPNARIRVGIFGIDGERSRPTTYSDWVTVEQGTDVSGGSAQPPTPSVYEQWMNALDEKHEEWNEQEQARQDAETARVEAEQAREDLETGYVARAEAAAESAEAAAKVAEDAAKVAEDAKDVIGDVVEGNFATKSYVDQQIAAIPTPDVSGQINEHNTSETAHEDIRTALAGKAKSSHTHTAADVGALPISGGTLTGNLLFSGSDPIICNESGQRGKRIRLYSGAGGNYSGGASINLYQSNHTSSPGVFTVAAHNGENSAVLTGYPDGKLTWKGGNIYHTGNKPTAVDVGALPISGGHATGNITVEKASSPAYSLRNTSNGRHSYFVMPDGDGSVTIANRVDDANRNQLIISPETSTVDNALMLYWVINGSGTVYKVHHAGNKPIGSYSGNGSSTQRTISTGGIGRVLFVWSSYSFGFVTPAGAMFYRSGNGTSYDSDTIRFSNTATDAEGILVIKGNHANYNSSSYTYYYQVL